MATYDLTTKLLIKLSDTNYTILRTFFGLVNKCGIAFNISSIFPG
jgi:hypothetical protein